MKTVELMLRDTLPPKKFFNSHELALWLNVEAHEIRFWEAEFPEIRSHKTAKGQKIYRREDVVLFSSIKHLIKEKKLTIAGAQKVMAESDKALPGLDDMESKVATVPKTSSLDPQVVLKEAAVLVNQDDDEFDDVAHRIYQSCSQELKPACAVETDQKIALVDFYKTRATLMASKDSLNEVLVMLDKYQENKNVP